MSITTLYYFLGFIFFIACLVGIQKWVKLPQQKKDRVGLIVLSALLFSLIGFVFLVLFGFLHFNGDYAVSLSMLFFFLFIVFTTFFLMWYNDKYNTKINIGRVVIILCLSAFGIIFLYLKKIGHVENEKLLQNISLQTVVTNIVFDTHKPYFKDMILADGQHLPMPETMNNTLQIGDSIYKTKGEKFYTVINFKTKTKTQYAVATHIRVLGKPQ